MVPPNQKPNTFYSAFIWGGTVCNGKVLSGTHGPQKTKARPRMQHCGAPGLVSQTSISVFIHAAIFVWTQRSLRGLSEFCSPPPPTLCFCQQEKNSKSEIFTINFRSMQRSFSFPPFFWLRLPFGSCGLLSPPPHSDVGHFTFISSKTPIVLNVIWKKEVKEATLKKNETKKYRLMPITRKEGRRGSIDWTTRAGGQMLICVKTNFQLLSGGRGVGGGGACEWKQGRTSTDGLAWSLSSETLPLLQRNRIFF